MRVKGERERSRNGGVIVSFLDMGAGRLVLGSVSEYMVNNCHCDLLIAK